MKNKKQVIVIAAVVAVLALLLGLYFGLRPQTSSGEKKFTLTVVHADGSSREFAIASDEEFLSHALIAEGILTDEGLETGMYLTVDGEVALWNESIQSYWCLYVGDEYAMYGMNDTPIEDGGEYKLEYTLG